MDENWSAQDVKGALRAEASKSAHCVVEPYKACGVDGYNTESTGDVSITIRAGKSDQDHVGCVAYRNSGYGDMVEGVGIMARDYKSASDLVVEPKPRKYIVRRLTPTECARLQGFPNVAEVDVGEMTRDEIAMFCLSEDLIRMNLDTGTIYGIRGPGGIAMKEWRELKGTLQNGYVVHTLNVGGIKKQVKAHRIVWIAAHGMIPDGMVIDHINNDKTDNRLCNLQILSPEDNSIKARQDGLYMTGEKSATAKISDDDKKTIQFLYWHTDMLQKRIGEMFGLCQQRVSQIVHEDCSWCEGLGGSDSAIYKAYGNGLALPCAYDVLHRIANFIKEDNNNG